MTYQWVDDPEVTVRIACYGKECDGEMEALKVNPERSPITWGYIWFCPACRRFFPRLDSRRWRDRMRERQVA